MEEESVYDSFPDLKELENKIGMKTPESLLRWMQGNASLGAEWSSNRPEGTDNRTSDSLTDKIRNLKLEMVRIPLQNAILNSSVRFDYTNCVCAFIYSVQLFYDWVYFSKLYKCCIELSHQTMFGWH